MLEATPVLAIVPTLRTIKINAGLTAVREALAVNRLLVRQLRTELSGDPLEMGHLLAQLETERYELQNAVRFLGPFEDME